MAKKDLTGQRFGRLTVVRSIHTDKKGRAMWLCKCDCGGEKEVSTYQLTSGNTKSCGCLRTEHSRRVDISGQRFGRLVAVSFSHYNEKHQDCWLFHCDCGNDKIMPAANVKWGNTRSCGCLHRERTEDIKKQDITGCRFDRLVALRPTENRDAAGSVIWECQCDCGKTAFYSVNVLNRGKVHSCGCMYRETRAECYSYRHDMAEDTNISSLVVSKQLRRNNTSGCTGVYQEKKHGYWVAYIHFRKHRYSLGVYTDKEKAIRARKEAERRLHDPLIEENIVNLTDKSRKIFLEYLQKDIN